MAITEARDKMDYQSLAEKNGLQEKDIMEVERLVLGRGNFTRDIVQNEISWFFGKLGIGEYYFQTTPIPIIARHIESLRRLGSVSQNGSNLKSGEIRVGLLKLFK
jgi:hypothetical protein